ncbi:MAG: CobW family GTP-binding protein [Gemmatimonas sp.]|uniref:CobW family GTP-binding protein n=1 Tax=Gemmatimonas sp. TaxID=1962908 RepID=UPI0025C1D5C9|nr:GTP-binding protein [Gemmatimonas sp.]MCE2953834.1 GTP-binding protein [Gemmatimonas sp.]
MASPTLAGRSARTRPLAVTVISGFLGAGKTTLLRRLLRDRSDLRMAVIVNDLSDLAVDADLVKELKEGDEELVIDLHAGSLGGSLRPAFRDALDRVAADPSLDYLLIETSGGSHPHALLEDIQRHRGLTLDGVVTVVDGLNLWRDFDGGRALLQDAPPSISPVSLLRAQIEAASVLLVSKADRLTRAQVTDVFAVLHQLNVHALIVSMAYGQVDPALIVGARSFQKRRRRPRGEPVRRSPVAPAPDDPAVYGLGSVTLRHTRPFHPQRLHTLVRESLPLGVHRSKGWIWLASRPLDVLVWSHAGSWVGLEWAATWKAGILLDPAARLLPEERAGLTAALAQLDPVFGDRHCELTIIGVEPDRTAFADALRHCLCTDAEVAAWQNGERFDDPWPQTIRRV